MTNKLKDRAARCVTHHAACDCREYAYRERIERLEAALQWYAKPRRPEEFLSDMGRRAREALADDGARSPSAMRDAAGNEFHDNAVGGGGEKPPHERPRLEHKYSGVIGTSPRRDALQALQRIRHRWAECCDDHEPSLIEMRADCEAVRRTITDQQDEIESQYKMIDYWTRECEKVRARTAPPTVPDDNDE